MRAKIENELLIVSIVPCLLAFHEYTVLVNPEACFQLEVVLFEDVCLRYAGVCFYRLHGFAFGP